MIRSAVLLLVLTLASLVWVTPARPTGAFAADAPAAWPLAKGSVWTYQGFVRWPLHPESSPEVVEKPITWQMSVLDVIPRGHVVAAVMRGHPADIFSPQPLDAVPSDYLLIAVDASKYYEVRGDERVARVLARLQDPADLLVDLVQDEDLVLDLPLTAGKRFCEAFQITRLDGGYCWVVDGEQPAELDGVIGDSSVPGLTEYQVHKGAVSGSVVIGFVPGVGITRFRGMHQGVRWEADLRLVAYLPGEH